MRWLIKQLHTVTHRSIVCIQIHKTGKRNTCERFRKFSLSLFHSPSLSLFFNINERTLYAIWAGGIFMACRILNNWICLCIQWVYLWASEHTNERATELKQPVRMMWKINTKKPMKRKACINLASFFHQFQWLFVHQINWNIWRIHENVTPFEI